MFSCSTPPEEQSAQNTENSENFKADSFPDPPQDLEGPAETWIRKWDEGVNFFATGNEPFWSLDLTFGERFIFETAEGLVINTPPVEAIRAMDADVRLYKLKTDSAMMDITLSRNECMDSMNGQQRDFTVRIRYQTNPEQEFTEVSGCGNFIPNPGLHNIWALDSINSTGKSSFSRTPYMEVNITQKQLLVYDGCKEFSTGFYIDKDNKLVTRRVEIQAEECKDPGNAEMLRSHLSSSQLQYSFENNRLVLISRNGKSVWRAAD